MCIYWINHNGGHFLTNVWRRKGDIPCYSRCSNPCHSTSTSVNKTSPERSDKHCIHAPPTTSFPSRNHPSWSRYIVSTRESHYSTNHNWPGPDPTTAMPFLAQGSMHIHYPLYQKCIYQPQVHEDTRHLQLPSRVWWSSYSILTSMIWLRLSRDYRLWWCCYTLELKPFICDYNVPDVTSRIVAVSLILTFA